MSDLFGTVAPMPALSLWEPWASLIVAGFKRHETRHWYTRVRGQVAIHAAKRVDVGGAPDRLCAFAFGADWAKTRPVGCVVAVARLTGCFATDDPLMYENLRESDELSGNYAPHRFAFRIDDVRPLFEPLPLIGRQGFFSWKPPADLEARLAPPVDHTAAADRWDARQC